MLNLKFIYCHISQQKRVLIERRIDNRQLSW